jgi:hypothetical protein
MTQPTNSTRLRRGVLRLVCPLVCVGLTMLGPAALADDDHGDRHGREGSGRSHHGDGQSHYGDDDHGTMYRPGGHNDGGYNGGHHHGGSYQRRGPYSQGYRDGMRQGTYDGQNDCSRRSGGGHRSHRPQDDYDRGYADGYSAGYNRYCY